MKSIIESFAVVAILLLALTSRTSANINYCGLDPCFIPVPESCGRLKRENFFAGSCCNLEPILATGGCRVTVKAGGNCFWTPKCFPCPIGAMCNIDHQSDNTDVCEPDNFNVLSQEPDDAVDNFSCAPTMAPTESMQAASPSSAVMTNPFIYYNNNNMFVPLVIAIGYVGIFLG